jgi:glycosyltransferase involved in cell wall biosynthesis
MNILHVIDQLSMTHGGGAAKVTSQLAEQQAMMGHNVSVVTTNWHLNGQWPKGVSVKAFKLWGSPFGLRVAPGMMAWNVRRHTDVVHLHNYRTYPNFEFAVRRVPSVLEAHGSMPSRNVIMDKLLWNPFVFNCASAFIANSHLEVPQYQAAGAKSRQIHTIPVGIDWREFETLPGRYDAPYRTILSLGRLHPIKGVDILIEAFKLLDRNDVRLLIAGNDGGDELRLRGLAGRHKHIEFVGGVYGPDKVQTYVDADLYVLPSRYEMFGVTVLEALACGKPVVLTDTSGSARDLPHQCGLTCAPEPNDMADKIGQILDMLDAGDTHYADRRAYARAFGWDRLAERHIKVYEGIVR